MALACPPMAARRSDQTYLPLPYLPQTTVSLSFSLFLCLSFSLCPPFLSISLSSLFYLHFSQCVTVISRTHFAISLNTLDIIILSFLPPLKRKKEKRKIWALTHHAVNKVQILLPILNAIS